MMAQWHGPRARLLFDVMLAVVCFAGESVLWALQPVEFRPAAWLWPLVWLAFGYVPVVLRRTAVNWAVGLLVVNMCVAALVRDWSAGGLSLIVLTYTIASTCTVKYTLVTSFLLWVVPLGLALTPAGKRATDPIPIDLPAAYYIAYTTLMFLLVFFIGRTVVNRRAYVSALEDRARTAERDQRAVTEQAVADERRRIARELHDVVAHHVSVMSVLATGTRRALSRDPVAADEALATIEETGRVALREMRRLLVVLRTDAEPAGELEPQPGLPGLDELLEQVREAGLPVQLTTAGEPGHLDPGIALAVYRITQEALTNALKHAGPASAEVRLSFGTRELAIEISDTGRGPRPGPRTVGHGLLGMRERISLYGGSLRAGPRPGGGFRVFARIPLEGEQGNPLEATSTGAAVSVTLNGKDPA